MFVISYLLGKKANQNYFEMAKIAKDQYKKDNASLIEEQRKKEARDKKAEQITDDEKNALEEEKNKQLRELENKTANIDDVFQDIGVKKR